MPIAHREQIFFMRIYCVSLILAVILGVIFLGQEAWFDNPGLSGPKELVDWVPIDPWTVWGSLALLYGIFLILAIGRSISVHLLRFGGIWYIFFGVSLMWPRSGYTLAEAVGAVVFLMVAMVQIFLADHLRTNGWG